MKNEDDLRKLLNTTGFAFQLAIEEAIRKKERRGQIRSWLFTVDSGKGRFRRRESLLGSAANNPEQKSRLQREIDATDRQIDQLVYELYGLTDEEIKIVEANSGSN